MKINRLNLLARQGHLQFAEAPEAGGGGSTNDDQEKSASNEGADGDKSGGDSGDDSGDGDGEGDDGDDGESSSKGKDDEDDQGDADGFTPITSQAELNKVIKKRIDRERAKFSDYDQLKTENTQLKKDLAQERRGVLLRKVSEDTGIPEGLLRGDTEDELRAHADEIKAFTGAGGRTTRKPGHSPYTGTGGERPAKPSTDTGRERARATTK